MDISIIVMDPRFLEGHWSELDESGFDSLYLIDHPYMTTPDPWPFLAYVAGKTERIRLGTHVTAAPFHHPTELASAVATVDELSRGRTRVGIGAAYNKADFEPFGFRRPPIGERLDRMEEMLQVLKKLWTEEKAEFEGDYFQLRGGANLYPKPLQRPHPPLIVGVNAPGKGLEIAARQAQELNTWQHGPDAVADLSKAAAEACKQVGRAPETLRITSDVILLRGGDEAAAQEMSHGIRDGARAGGRGVRATQWGAGGILFGDADDMVKQAQRFDQIGVDELTVTISSVEDMNWFDSEVLPRIR
jgi:alkanesulfonate monooxygenase SsuD/methylene tetrahydromethanopterin reductase-like flavin-dependent oxidoreductase (luciferase family)